MDGNLLTFVLLSIVGIAILCGLLPAVYATRRSLRAGLQSGSSFITGRRSPTSLMRTVGVAQIAVSLVMITATCLFALNLGSLRRFDGGVKRDGLLEIEIDPSAAGYSESRAVLLDERLRSRFASIPGVDRATYSADGIYSDRNFSGEFKLDGNASSLHARDNDGIYDYIGPNFFTTLGTTILAGRDFTDRDTGSAAPVVIINQALATRFFPKQNPIGRNFYVSDGKDKKAYQIIGVVREVKSNVRMTGMSWYFAAKQHQVHPFSTCFLVGTTQEKVAVATAIRAAVHDEDSKLQVANVQSANDLFELTLQTDRLLAMLGWAFGILAILLACAGIYGLLSYDVARRTSEIGIRTALGACQSDIAKLMLSQAVFIIVFGVALGGITGNVLARLVRSLVFELRASDPRIELSAAVFLVAVALTAASIPIRRATRLDPMRALRTE